MSVTGTIAAAATLYFTGGNFQAAAAAYSIGAGVEAAFTPGPTNYGPRLEDLRPQASEYGKPIPICYGTVGMGGNVIWASDYVEREVEADGGGKGGSSPTNINYEYFGNFAVAFAEGECDIGQMWAGPGKRLIYDGTLLEGGGSVRIYRGTEDQLPDPLIESYLGVGNVPAYRGVCYAVFEMFPLSKDGNALPFITAQVGAKSGAHGQTPEPIGDAVPISNFNPALATVEPTNGWIWQVQDGFLTTDLSLRVFDPQNNAVVADFPDMDIPQGTIAGITTGGGLAYVLIKPFASRKAVVARFDIGQANPDGTALSVPSYLGWELYGDEIGDTPRDPEAIGHDGARLWIAYAFTNAANTNVAIYGSPTDFEFDSTSYLIGSPFHIAGGNVYMGIAGRLGPAAPSPNFLLYQGTSVAHALRVEMGEQGKVFDFDPKRNVFVFYRPNGMSWTTVDAETGEIEVHTLTVAQGDTTPTPTGLTRAITYSARMDRYLIGATTGGFGGEGTTVYVVNPDTYVTEGTYTFEAGGQLLSPLLDPVLKPNDRPYVISFDQSTVKKLFLAGAVEATPIGLGAVVADLSLRAGLTAEQIDVTALTDMVDGYAVARQTTVRAAIDALRPAYYFDAVESGGIVKFVKRGGQSVAVIEDDDLDAHQADGQPGDPLLTTRQMEVELPKTVNINYLSAATDYEKATQIYKRQIGSSEEEVTLDLPLVLTDTKGQEIAQVNAHAAWVQRLRYGPFALPRKYSDLEPTDIITIRGYEMMLEKVTASPGGVLTCEAVATDSSHYTPHVVVTETVPTEKIVYVPGETILELM